MPNMLNFIEDKILPPIGYLAELKHLRAVRDGIVSILPLIIIGSFFLLLGQLPLDALPPNLWSIDTQALIAKYHAIAPALLIPYRLTIKLMALFASFTIAYHLGKNYKLDGISCGLSSATCFILTQTPVRLENHWMLSLEDMGGSGLFAAILIAFLVVAIKRWCERHKLSFTMAEAVPASVTQAFANLIPAALSIALIWILAHLLHFKLVDLSLRLFQPLMFLGDTLWAVILINLIMQIIWLGGVHGASVVNAIFIPIWMGYLDANAAAANLHQTLPHLTTLPFYQWWIWIGGSGTTLSLAILLLFSKSAFLRRLGKISIVPGICNINEPLIFGMPLVMNPIMALPFILTPITCGIVAYLACWLNLVHRPYLLPPWTLPAPLGAWLATGFDWRAIILVLVNLTLSTLIYLPFLKAYEHKLQAENHED